MKPGGTIVSPLKAFAPHFKKTNLKITRKIPQPTSLCFFAFLSQDYSSKNRFFQSDQPLKKSKNMQESNEYLNTVVDN